MGSVNSYYEFTKAEKSADNIIKTYVFVNPNSKKPLSLDLFRGDLFSTKMCSDSQRDKEYANMVVSILNARGMSCTWRIDTLDMGVEKYSTIEVVCK
jgi:hypothetical protein